MAAGTTQAGTAKFARPSVPVDRLAKPSSRTRANAARSLISKMLSAVNCGCATCRTPAMNSRTPTAQNTNHLRREA